MACPLCSLQRSWCVGKGQCACAVSWEEGHSGPFLKGKTVAVHLLHAVSPFIQLFLTFPNSLEASTAVLHGRCGCLVVIKGTNKVKDGEE